MWQLFCKGAHREWKNFPVCEEVSDETWEERFSFQIRSQTKHLNVKKDDEDLSSEDDGEELIMEDKNFLMLQKNLHM